MKLYDAHNHLQDDHLLDRVDEFVKQTQEIGVARMVVNGACEADWGTVKTLAEKFPCVLPSFGYHPWFVQEATPAWKETLIHFLDSTPGSVIGEIGLDRWKEPVNIEAQEPIFTWQLALASERNLPASIHCLKAWGMLQNILENHPRPQCGFLLHSYGGSIDLVKPMVRLGAYFSFPGYYLHERKERQRETFRHVPLDRLLVETDAPAQPLPESKRAFHLVDPSSGEAFNHPANLRVIYEGLAETLGMGVDALATQVEANFNRLFLRGE
jgi:TatD DNase family protein